GRRHELADLRYLLEAARLVTLVGTGGSGKTRLAVELARTLSEAGAAGLGSAASGSLPVAASPPPACPEGICFVDLSVISEGPQVARAVLQALGEPPAAREAPAEAIGRCIGRRALLLVLDNCEQVVEACAGLSEDLLVTCPQLQIVATSREPLHAAGEAVYRVPALSLPSAGDGSFWGELAASEAVQLFLDRARLLRPGFGLTEDNAEAVARVCRGLDGLPLALELAAARLQSFSPQELATRLDRALEWLGGGRRLAPGRQQTLRATLDWSHALLSEAERSWFRRLAVFRDGFDLEAAEAVLGAPSGPAGADTLPLHELVNKSLVVVEQRRWRTRYRLLETVRSYALEQMEAAGQTWETRRRHLTWCADLAARSEEGLTGSQQAAWLTRWEEERENLRDALGFALEQEPTAVEGLWLAIRLRQVWELRLDPREGRGWIGRLLEHAPKAPSGLIGRALRLDAWLAFRLGEYGAARRGMEAALAKLRDAGDPEEESALSALASICRFQGDCRTALGYATQGLQLCRARGNERGIASALNEIGSASFALGEDQAARAALQECLDLCHRLGHRQGVAATLANLQMVLLRQGDYAGARNTVEEALRIQRGLGNQRGVALAMSNLGHITRREGDAAEALVCFQQALRLYRELDYPVGLAQVLWGFALIAPAERGPRSAARLLGAAEAQRETHAYSLWYPVDCDGEALRRTLAGALGADGFRAAYESGRGLSLEEALEEAARLPLSTR
ncbi:MAG TPA: tetratricopeptide repeat protein, partial [Steroidobacteraceae bacterium]|nr:tetratricopeptide repeat protein [Steroidobacteraceae bacterium]